MRSLQRRLQELEAKDPSRLKRWHRVIQYEDEGQTEQEAIAEYEAENGPIGEDDCLVVRIIKPGFRPDAQPA